MTLRLQSDTLRRTVFAACCGAPDSPLTQDQKREVLRGLGDHTWAPTPENTSVDFRAVEAWYEQHLRKIPRPMPETRRN